MTINPLRKIIQRFGLDLHRHRPSPDKLNWLKVFEIKTIIDVGANVGQFASEIREVFPKARIYSFEPISDCYQQLQNKMKLDTNFKAFNCGLGEEVGELVINRSSYSPGSSILEMEREAQVLFPHIKKDRVEKIKISRLDNIAEFNGPTIEKDILLKIDTEGYEGKVLAGGPQLLSQVKVIIIENSYLPRFKGQVLFPEIYDLLTSFGFVYRGALSQKMNMNTGEIIFEDSFFVKP